MHSLLARLLVVITIALLPALTFQAYTAADARSVRQQLMEDEALRLVRLVAFEQERIIEGAEQVLDAISGAPTVQDHIPQLCQRLLSNLVTGNPRYVAAIVIGLDGKIQCAANPADIGRDLSDRWYFQEALRKNDLAISNYSVGRGSGEKIIAIAKPFRTQDGIVAGVVEVSLSLKWLGDQLARIAFPPDTTARIADRNGVILARVPDSERYVGRTILEENHFTRRIQVPERTPPV